MKLALLLLLLSSLSMLGDGSAGPGGFSGRGRFVVLLVALSLAAGPAFAVGARPLGMGSAYLGISDDENGLFFNIAGLSQLDKELNQVS
ncbi:MAG: hypothetical protein HY815_04500, partial [Candidatus Riflebacteria bacterium]|nr:hypothetical protein [Candidatus Riflebacteria bacterium]